VVLPAVTTKGRKYLSYLGQVQANFLHDVWAAAAPAPSTKKPVGHASHVRSAVAVPAMKASPAWQVAVVQGVHVAVLKSKPPVPAAAVTKPSVHASQVRSAVALQAMKPGPAAGPAPEEDQSVHVAWRAVLPVAVKKPYVHASQVRSAVALPAIQA
jgi:hypothetical protein